MTPVVTGPARDTADNGPLRSESGRFRARQLPVIGWRERVTLPDLDIRRIRAKVDTGARTSALRVSRLTEFERDGRAWVRFTVNPGRRRAGRRRVEAPLRDRRIVVSSNGMPEERPVIRTGVTISGKTFTMNLTLTRRNGMTFPMLLGREAVRGRFVVDPGHSYLTNGNSGGDNGAG